MDRWFNIDFVTPNTPGQFGTAGRGLVPAPGWKTFDYLASKNFNMPREGHRLQFRFEAFNLTNKPQFWPANINIGRAPAGTISNAADPRLIQFALKYVF